MKDNVLYGIHRSITVMQPERKSWLLSAGSCQAHDPLLLDQRQEPHCRSAWTLRIASTSAALFDDDPIVKVKGNPEYARHEERARFKM